jgi:hypothetical protein
LQLEKLIYAGNSSLDGGGEWQSVAMVNFILPYEAKYKSTTRSRVAMKVPERRFMGISEGQIACGVD